MYTINVPNHLRKRDNGSPIHDCPSADLCDGEGFPYLATPSEPATMRMRCQTCGFSWRPCANVITAIAEILQTHDAQLELMRTALAETYGIECPDLGGRMSSQPEFKKGDVVRRIGSDGLGHVVVGRMPCAQFYDGTKFHPPTYYMELEGAHRYANPMKFELVPDTVECTCIEHHGGGGYVLEVPADGCPIHGPAAREGQ